MFNYILGIVSVLTIIGGIYYGQGIKKWVLNKRDKFKLIMSLMDKIKTDVSVKKDAVSFTVNDTSQSATIIYKRLTQEYVLFVPYNRNYVIRMSQFRAVLLRNNNEPLNITQQPGIPYLVNAKSLGGYAIRITNDENESMHEYGLEEIPYYAEDIMS